MNNLDGVKTKDDLLLWSQARRKWRDDLRRKTPRCTSLRLTTMPTGGTMCKPKAELAEDIIRGIERLEKTPGASSSDAKASPSNVTDAPPAKMPKTVEAPSPATPKPTGHTSRSRSARRGGGNMMDANASTPARLPHAAEALAMSTRKSIAVDSKVTSPDMAQPFSRRSKLSADDVTPIVLEELAGARAHIKSLAGALKELKGNAPRAIWPKKTGVQSGLYYKLRTIRRQYKDTYVFRSH